MLNIGTKMASFLRYTLFTFYIIFFTTLIHNSDGAFYEDVSEMLTNKRIQKTSHLHFYFHDILSGKNPSTMRIVEPPKSASVFGFGNTYMMDDPLTEGPERNSKIVGRAQGMYAFTSQQGFSLLMAVNYAFNEGKYNGSSISILGRNPILNDKREMPIVGGTGLFRFARGYALAHTYWADPKTGDAIVEYNVFVQHF